MLGRIKQMFNLDQNVHLTYLPILIIKKRLNHYCWASTYDLNFLFIVKKADDCSHFGK